MDVAQRELRPTPTRIHPPIIQTFPSRNPNLGSTSISNLNFMGQGGGGRDGGGIGAGSPCRRPAARPQDQSQPQIQRPPIHEDRLINQDPLQDRPLILTNRWNSKSNRLMKRHTVAMATLYPNQHKEMASGQQPAAIQLEMAPDKKTQNTINQ